MSEHAFRPSARILDSIGKDLIKDEVAAIIELIKNSFDADAENVNINFFIKDNQLNLSIMDDGIGMSHETFIKKWLVPGTNNKIKNPYSLIKKRRVLGAKGLGRYSVSILGAKMKLTSISNKKKIVTNLNWEEISKVDFLDEVKINVNENETNKDNCTEIIINNLYQKENWITAKQDTNSFKKLIHNLKLLVAPQEVNSDFNICVKFSDESNKEVYNEQIEPYELLDYYHYQLKGKIDCINNEFDISITNNRYRQSVTDKIPTNHPSIIELKKLNFKEPFEFDFRVFERDANSVKDFISNGVKSHGDTFKRAEALQLLDNIAGIKIYKNSFRIRPYGDVGDDWLGLNKQRFLNPTEKISANQISGNIIFSTQNEKTILLEKSARDGFIENDDFYKFKDTILNLMVLLTNERANVKKQKQDDNKSRTLEEKIDNISNNLSLKKSITGQLELLKIPVENISTINEIIDKETEEQKKIIEEIKLEVAMYQQQVTLGKLISVLMHEGRKNISVLRETPDDLIYGLKKILKDSSQHETNEIISDAETIKSHSIMISDLFKKIDPLSRKRSPNRKIFSIDTAFKKALKSFGKEIEKHDISIIKNLTIDTVLGWELDFVAAFTNLIDNSIYWMNGQEKKEIIISSKIVNKKMLIEYVDSGSGIPVEYLEDDKIFEPGRSYKIDGTGLGLAIAGEGLKRNAFILKAIEYDKGAHFIMESEEKIYEESN